MFILFNYEIMMFSQEIYLIIKLKYIVKKIFFTIHVKSILMFYIFFVIIRTFLWLWNKF